MLRTVGVLGRDEGLRREAVALAKAWLKDPAAVEADMVAPVVSVAVASGDGTLLTSLAEFLATSSDRVRREEIIGSLWSAQGNDVARVLLPLALDRRVEPAEGLELLRSLSRGRSNAAPPKTASFGSRAAIAS